MAITRTAWTDDDGSGTTGTVINNAVKTELYDQIDAALAAGLPLAGGTLAGDLKFTDATYDIGKAGATRPRDGFFSRHVTVGGDLTVGGQVSLVTSSALATNGVIGYNSVHGFFVYPKAGSSFDFRLFNAAGFDVIQVPTGTQKLKLAGHLAGASNFITGDKYLLVDATGNVHVSALGPAS